MTFAQKAYTIFEDATRAYHLTDNVDAPEPCSCRQGSVDAVQWHLEDIIRDPEIGPVRPSTPCSTTLPPVENSCRYIGK